MDAVLLYDRDCGLCATSAHWLRRHAVSTARVEAYQDADLVPLGLSTEDCAEAVQWTDNGRRAVGPDAIAAYLQTSSHSWRTAGRVLAAPASKRLTWPVYRWVSQHRDQIPARPPAEALPRTAGPPCCVRRRKARDLGASARLLRVVFSEGEYPVHWPDAPRAWLSGEDVIDAWVVERQGEILGHIAISKVDVDTISALRWREVTGYEPPRLAAVSRFFVRPRVRGQGIGTALLDVAAGEIRARGLVPVAEVVSRSGEAMRLFDAHGWRLRSFYPWGEKADGLQVYYYMWTPEHDSH